MWRINSFWRSSPWKPRRHATFLFFLLWHVFICKFLLRTLKNLNLFFVLNCTRFWFFKSVISSGFIIDRNLTYNISSGFIIDRNLIYNISSGFIIDRNLTYNISSGFIIDRNLTYNISSRFVFNSHCWNNGKMTTKDKRLLFKPVDLNCQLGFIIIYVLLSSEGNLFQENMVAM